MKIRITHIKWDTGDFSEEDELQSGVCVPDLPTELELDEDDPFMDEVREVAEETNDGTLDDRKNFEVALDAMETNGELSDLLSDRYGYCLYGFSYEVVWE